MHGAKITEARTTRALRWVNPFRSALKQPAPIERRVPDGMRVYCVGDVHGRDDLLGEMAERVKSDLNGSSFQTVTVFLGDYVDRGLGSVRVVERLARGEWPTSVVALRGNHEDLLLSFLEDASILAKLAGFGRARDAAFLRGECRLGDGWSQFRSGSARICGALPARTPAVLRGPQALN